MIGRSILFVQDHMKPMLLISIRTLMLSQVGSVNAIIRSLKDFHVILPATVCVRLDSGSVSWSRVKPLREKCHVESVTVNLPSTMRVTESNLVIEYMTLNTGY